jgi:hypothetical protein
LRAVSEDSLPPAFPTFKPLELRDRSFVEELLWRSQPQASEYTFTNLFIWRWRYQVSWACLGEWLLFLCRDHDGTPYGLQPIGPHPEAAVVREFMNWLGPQVGPAMARLERVEERWAQVVEEDGGLVVEPDREQFDYVYRTQDLIQLAGRKYHSKRNHVNRAFRELSPTYEPLTERHVQACLEVASRWCAARRCCDDLTLVDEWDAVREALRHFPDLHAEGGVVLIDGKVQAFALGELLNADTAVVHLEKANPDIPPLFALINQQTCAHLWPEVPFVNREQDLGDPGLRRAKESYHPHHMVRKFRVRYR